MPIYRLYFICIKKFFFKKNYVLPKKNVLRNAKFLENKIICRGHKQKDLGRMKEERLSYNFVFSSSNFHGENKYYDIKN